MDMNNVNIEEIVKQVLSEHDRKRSGSSCCTKQLRLLRQETQFRKKLRVAMMTEKKHFELQEY